MRMLLLVAALAGTAGLAAYPQASFGQTTPRGVEKQARADRRPDDAHRVRRDESMSKTPEVVRKRDKLTHHKPHKQKMSM